MAPLASHLLLFAVALASPPDQSATSGGETSSAIIPRAVLFGNPDRSAVRVSGDGSHLGWLAPHDGVLNIWVQELEAGRRGGESTPVTRSTGRPIRQWEFVPGMDAVVYLLDEGGDEDFRVYVADIPGRGGEPDRAREKPQGAPQEARCITPWEGVRSKLLAVDERHPGEVLVACNRRDRANFDVWRIDVRSGEAREVYRNELAWFDMLPDGEWNIRVVRRYLEDGGAEVLHLPKLGGEWRRLARWSPEDAGASRPLGVSADGRSVYLADSSRPDSLDTGGLYEVTFPDDGEPVWTRLAQDQRSEPRQVVVDPATKRVQAVGFEWTKLRWEVLDPGVAREFALFRTIGNGLVEINGRTRDDSLWAIQHTDDVTGTTHWLLHREGKGLRTERLFAASELLGSGRMRPPLQAMEPKVIRARDGLELVSYLTLPEGFNAGASPPVPMVLLVHGGPWTRDSWGFHPTHQWLANRGYAVLSVNFRGSTGFGKRHTSAGDRQWSKAMQDDLNDAVDWAIAERIADPTKVAIMGQSYGGYATLVGLTFTPTRFACGVDIVGPANLRSLLNAIPAYWAAERGMLDRRVGRVDEGEWLDSISPLSKIDQLRRPLLIGQGANDPRVPRSESDQIVAGARSRGVPIAYVVFPDEGHGFARPDNRMAFMAITEAFLGRQLGGKVEPMGEDLARSSARIEAGETLIQSLCGERGNAAD